MRLIIHPGYPKTATTWLQAHALRQAGIWLLAKGSAGDGSESHWDPAVRDLQYRVFSPVSGPETMWERFRNSGPAVRAYARVIARELNTAASGAVPESAASQGAVGTEVAVLTDETILAYGGAEINTPLLAYFATALREELDPAADVSIEVVLTIREQTALLRSFFAYDFAHQRAFFPDFESFVRAGIADPCGGLFGWVFYDDLAAILASTLPRFVGVRMVPYEILTTKGPAEFLTAFLGSELGVGADSLPSLEADATPYAVNKQSDSGYRLRDFSHRWRALHQARERAVALAPPPLDRLVRAGFGDARLANAASSIRLLKQRAELTAEQRQSIRALYAENNRALETRFGLDLGSLGYAV